MCCRRVARISGGDDDHETVCAIDLRVHMS